jgi:putative endonuclease
VTSHDFGRSGEQLAATYLASHGYKILQRNLRTRWGEVDIVCETPRFIVFVEVKSWKSLSGQSLGLSIDRRKQRRIIQVARRFLTEHRREVGVKSVRFDVVVVSGLDHEPQHIEGAFESEWPE